MEKLSKLAQSWTVYNPTQTTKMLKGLGKHVTCQKHFFTCDTHQWVLGWKEISNEQGKDTKIFEAYTVKRFSNKNLSKSPQTLFWMPRLISTCSLKHRRKTTCIQRQIKENFLLVLKYAIKYMFLPFQSILLQFREDYYNNVTLLIFFFLPSMQFSTWLIM